MSLGQLTDWLQCGRLVHWVSGVLAWPTGRTASRAASRNLWSPDKSVGEEVLSTVAELASHFAYQSLDLRGCADR